jgi:hypothetical protein
VTDWPHPPTVEAAIRECYAMHAIMMQLGYEPDHVFICTQPVLNVIPAGQVCAICRIDRGGKVFNYVIRALNGPEVPEFERQWRAFAESKPSMPRAELDRIVYGSTIWAKKTELLWALARKGFPIEPGKVTN